MTQKNRAFRDLLNILKKSPTPSGVPLETEDTPQNDIQALNTTIEQLLDTQDEDIIVELIKIGEKLVALKQEAQSDESKLTPKPDRYSHRFDGRNYQVGKGVESLANSTAIEETIAFADEVERLYKQGTDRRSAYSQAKANLTNME